MREKARKGIRTPRSILGCFGSSSDGLNGRCPNQHDREVESLLNLTLQRGRRLNGNTIETQQKWKDRRRL